MVLEHEDKEPKERIRQRETPSHTHGQMIFNEVPTPHNRQRTIFQQMLRILEIIMQKKKMRIGLYLLSSPPTKINPKWIKYPNIKLLHR